MLGYPVSLSVILELIYTFVTHGLTNFHLKVGLLQSPSMLMMLMLLILSRIPAQPEKKKKNPKTLCIFCSLCWNTFLCPKCHSLEDEAQKSLLLILYPGCSTMVETLPLCLQWQDFMSQLKPSLQSIVTVHPFYTHQIANIKVQSINISWLILILSLFFSLALVEIIVLAL